MARLLDRFAIHGITAEVRELGDASSLIYRVETPDGALFVKRTSGPPPEGPMHLLRFLAEHGIPDVIAPIATRSGELADVREADSLIVFPFAEGASGGDGGMREADWTALGAALRRIHELEAPDDLVRLLRAEAFDPVDRATVVALMEASERSAPSDPLDQAVTTVWRGHREALNQITGRIGALASAAARRSDERVICHADVHPWNVLVRAQGIALIDWDDAELAPRERDLMMLGIWADERGLAAFHDGYGPCESDRTLIAYFLNERVIQDLAAYGTLASDHAAPRAVRATALAGLTDLFEPGGEVATAIDADEERDPAHRNASA
jgi:spectinomycin phosphotransferase